ncbi:Uncharacterised protein [Mycobacterium tuberculosis]|uniref:Uncharacterized protein n=1 Tax=Mycobacterium tuberculosis TaxID=1773 RepID=A0A0U0RJR2_MYCTX|nr:Uncharacterised protein [Mycobacterium tuberculosis]
MLVSSKASAARLRILFCWLWLNTAGSSCGPR